MLDETRRRLQASLLLLALVCAGCSQPQQQSPAPTPAAVQARNLVLITIDTLRADRVGAYGYARARTPQIDALAARGVRFEHAFATAPITLPSHASLMTGRYPPGHGSRHNGIKVDATVPTLAKALSAAGFTSGAFVSAFPLDRRFGLNDGFAAYDDKMPREGRKRAENERAGRLTVDQAIAWLRLTPPGPGNRLFLWVHLFEPHAPYGDPKSGRPALDRYDDEIAESDVQVGRVIEALGPEAASSLIVVAADHGEAFGEHGEVSHSLFVYDTTLRVPLIVAGPGTRPVVVNSPVSLVDVAPTVLRLLGVTPFDADGIDLTPSFGGAALAARELYAESFAPLLDFGWSPLRALRRDSFKYIEAPKPELYNLSSDAGEASNIVAADATRAAAMRERVERYSPAALNASAGPALDREARARLQALGYSSGTSVSGTGTRPDPKDKVATAARLSEVLSGELQGAALEKALREILAADPKNPQANLRLGYVLLEAGRCDQAVAYLKTAIAGHVPTADAHLGLGLCQVRERRLQDAILSLTEANRIEPENPVVSANLGIVYMDLGRTREAIGALTHATDLDPDFHEARFNLVRAYARAGDRQAAATHARELLKRLPANAPQRAEVERLLTALQ